MGNVCIAGGQVYLDHRFQNKTVYLKDGKIKVLEMGTIPSEDGVEVVDASGLKVVPGFIDTHSHGAVGVDVNGATAEDLETISRFMASHGTTAWHCSILTDSREQTQWCIDQVCQHDRMEHTGAELAGIHLEGPFLAKEYKGAMPENLLKNGDIELIRRYQEKAGGRIKYITASPEVSGVLDMLLALRGMGMVVGIGHSGATYEQSMAAIERGVTVGTHVGNAMRLFHQHEPAIWGALMESDAYCEIICDGRHLAPGAVRLYRKIKGLGRLVAITDSIMATGLPDGEYHLGVNEVVVEDGDVKLKSNGARAGSTLTLDVALRNLLQWLPDPLEDILPILTENPAKEMGLWVRKGSIANGKDGDIVLLNQENQITSVFVRGKQYI